MTLHPMTLVTVVTEALACDTVVRILEEEGAHGWTGFPVQGRGSHGTRAADIPELANVQVEAIVPPAVAERALARLAQECFARWAMVAFASDVRVLRPEKFARAPR